MNRTIKVLAFSLFFLLFVNISSSFAGVPPPPPGGGGPPCFPPPCIPIDGGITFLVVAGIAFGGKKIYDSRKKITESTQS